MKSTDNSTRLMGRAHIPRINVKKIREAMLVSGRKVSVIILYGSYSTISTDAPSAHMSMHLHIMLLCPCCNCVE